MADTGRLDRANQYQLFATSTVGAEVALISLQRFVAAWNLHTIPKKEFLAHLFLQEKITPLWQAKFLRSLLQRTFSCRSPDIPWPTSPSLDLTRWRADRTCRPNGATCVRSRLQQWADIHRSRESWLTKTLPTFSQRLAVLSNLAQFSYSLWLWLLLVLSTMLCTAFHYDDCCLCR